MELDLKRRVDSQFPLMETGMPQPNNKTTSTLRENVDTLREDGEALASSAYRAATNTANDVIEEVTTEGEELIRAVSDYVAARPIASLGIAAAAGFIIAKVLR
jgi:ElaB/YqjD/DUF883 family membrane-anchored ribosome-binding protein